MVIGARGQQAGSQVTVVSVCSALPVSHMFFFFLIPCSCTFDDNYWWGPLAERPHRWASEVQCGPVTCPGRRMYWL